MNVIVDGRDRRPPRASVLQRTVKKTIILSVAVISVTYIPFLLIGLWNRVLGGWSSVFFVYAGGQKYMAAYRPKWLPPGFVWRPSPIGLLWQEGGCGIVLAAPITEAEFLAPANADQFEKLLSRLNLIGRLMGVREINLAGILPSVLAKRSGNTPLRHRDTRAPTVAAVMCAIETLVVEEFDSTPVPVVLIGGAGHIGREVASELSRRSYDVRIVDPSVGTKTLPEDLRNRRCLVVDVARQGVLARFLPDVWPEAVVLGETFPEPSRRDCATAKARGIHMYHLSGVQGHIWPSLPGGYRSAVPCCAACGPIVSDVKLLRLA